MIGLAVGIDYSLLIISRFRDEMGRGLDKRTAVVRAGATAGRTVLFSGITVVVALLGLLIVPFPFFIVPCFGRNPCRSGCIGRNAYAFAAGTRVDGGEGEFPTDSLLPKGQG